MPGNEAMQITRSEIQAGGIFAIPFFFIQALLVLAGAIAVPSSFIGYNTNALLTGGLGYVLVITIVYVPLSIVVLGMLGEDLLTSITAMTALWTVLGIILVSVGFFTAIYFVVGIPIVIASSAIAAKALNHMV
jgi:hypothetical protein